MLLSASRTSRTGKIKPVRAGAPMAWTGWMHDFRTERNVAYVKNGQVIRDPEGTLVAEVMIGDTRWWGTTSMWGDWTLGFRSCDDLRLRVMCFAWLALAWRMQRTIDNDA